VRFVDVWARDVQAQRHDHFVLQVATLPVPKGCAPPPARWSDLGWVGDDAGLFTELSDRSVEVGFTWVDPAAGQFPPVTKVGVIAVVGVEEQHLVSVSMTTTRTALRSMTGRSFGNGVPWTSMVMPRSRRAA
jgi:hypothetical protein